MKAKKWLKQFCIEKDEALKSICAEISSYITLDDLMEIDGWTDEECFLISNEIKTKGYLHDGYACPWCRMESIKQRENDSSLCDSCGYGMRHGICDDENSLYSHIKNCLGRHIIYAINLENLPVWKEEIKE